MTSQLTKYLPVSGGDPLWSSLGSTAQASSVIFVVVHQVCYTGEGVLVRDVVEIVVILLDVVVSALVLVPVVGTVIGTQVRERCQWTHHMDKLYMLALLDVRIMNVPSCPCKWNKSDPRGTEDPTLVSSQ